MSMNDTNHFFIWNLIGAIIIAALLGAAAFGFYRIYNNLEDSIINARVIKSLKNNIGYDTPDTKSLDKIKKKINDKQNITSMPTSTRNIFNYE